MNKLKTLFCAVFTLLLVNATAQADSSNFAGPYVGISGSGYGVNEQLRIEFGEQVITANTSSDATFETTFIAADQADGSIVVKVIGQISTKTVFSSDLDINSTGSKKLLDICKSFSADTYISGEMGHDYLDMDIFKDENIDVIFEKFECPKYSQRYLGFKPNMSVIDLLFNDCNILNN